MPLNQEFYEKVAAEIAEKDQIFANFQKSDCGCVARFGYCSCTNLERACRFVSQQVAGTEFFTPEQREILISESVYCSEGSYSEEEVAPLSDIRLAALWLETTNDYVKSQL